MTVDQTVVLAILVVAVVVFAFDRLRVDVVALSVLVALVLTGVLDSDQALSGLSNPAVVTVFAVFILSGALVSTGVADILAGRLLGVAGSRQWRVVTTLMVACGLMSAFMNNIGATAILLPVALSISERTGIAASKLLMPLAFASLMGGNITAIGTPPNILANGILADHPDLEPFGFFDFAVTGVPVLLTGVVYMATIGQRLLPTRLGSGRVLGTSAFDDYLSTIVVGPTSRLIGLTVDEAGFGTGSPVRVIEVRRGRAARLTPHADTSILAGDQLTVQARLDDLAEFAAENGPGLEVDERSVGWTEVVSNRADQPLNLVEVMVAPDSRLVGRLLADARLRRRYDVLVLAVRRRRGPIQSNPETIRLQAGDSLVLTGSAERLVEVQGSEDFVALGPPTMAIRRHARAPVAVVAMGCAMLAAATGLVPLAIALLTAALVTVISGAITMDEACASVDWRAIFLIAGMLPLGTAMEDTGLAVLIAREMTDAIGGAGPLWVMLGVYVLTATVTSVISNAAATVLIVPIAIDAALTIGVSPLPFVMATVIAASTAFVLPVGHQVNVLVYTPGNYRFGDFARVGAGLTALIMVLVALLVPIVWPFHPS